ncbi:hypothetical protein DsansV1_C04g0048441 [Dioscorea sansibarensis]
MRMPVGLWKRSTAVSTLLTFCPDFVNLAKYVWVAIETEADVISLNKMFMKKKH